MHAAGRKYLATILAMPGLCLPGVAYDYLNDNN